jgi:hypothetical protein
LARTNAKYSISPKTTSNANAAVNAHPPRAIAASTRGITNKALIIRVQGMKIAQLRKWTTMKPISGFLEPKVLKILKSVS